MLRMFCCWRDVTMDASNKVARDQPLDLHLLTYIENTTVFIPLFYFVVFICDSFYRSVRDIKPVRGAKKVHCLIWFTASRCLSARSVRSTGFIPPIIFNQSHLVSPLHKQVCSSLRCVLWLDQYCRTGHGPRTLSRPWMDLLASICALDLFGLFGTVLNLIMDLHLHPDLLVQTSLFPQCWFGFLGFHHACQ